MPFLTLNGITIPTRRGGEVSSVVVGQRTRGPEGQLYLQRTGLKRRWRFSTVCLQRATADAVAGLVLGLGHRWGFDLAAADRPLTKQDGSTDSTYLYSDKGLGPSGSPIAPVESNTAADGYPVRVLVTAPSTILELAKHDSAVWVGTATTNLLGADSRDAENAPTGYTGINSPTLAADTSHYWQATKSLSVITTAGAQRGFITTLFTPGATGDYTATIYIKATSGQQLQVGIAKATLSTIWGSVNYTAPAAVSGLDPWVKVTVTATISDTADIGLFVRDVNAGDANDYYVDGLQIEQRDYPTAWVDGTRATGVYTLASVGFFQSLRSFTAFAWSRGSAGAVPDSAFCTIVHWRGATTTINLASLYVTPGGKLALNIYDAAGALTSVTGTTTLSPETTTHRLLAATFDHDTLAIKVYVDGTEEDSDTLSLAPDFSLVEAASIGDVTANEYRGYLDNVTVVPYAMTAGQLSDLASQGAQPPLLPAINAAGDAIGDDPVAVIGKLSRKSYQGASRSGVWASNEHVVEFELEEV